MKHLVRTLNDFEEIRETEQFFSLSENCFPPNCIAWSGASILSSLNSEIDKFEVTQRDYIDKYNQVSLQGRHLIRSTFQTDSERPSCLE
jgi:hypothetical protein